MTDNSYINNFYIVKFIISIILENEILDEKSHCGPDFNEIK
jgi:hypothetical protein